MGGRGGEVAVRLCRDLNVMGRTLHCVDTVVVVLGLSEEVERCLLGRGQQSGEFGCDRGRNCD